MHRKFISIVVALAAFTILASQVAMYWRGSAEQDALQWITRSYQVIHDLGSIDSGLAASQIALREFVASQDARTERVFEAAVGRVHSAFLEAQQLTSDDAVQQHRLHELAPLLERRITQLSVAFEQREGEASAPALTREIQEAVEASIRSEQRLLVQRVEQNDAAFARVRTVAVTSALLSLLIILLVFLVLRREGAKLSRSALYDELTGLYNRRGFQLMAEHRMQLAARHGQPLHLLFIDLNDMKRINDQLGHDCGDQALVHTARLLHGVFRESDVVARLGGDEFVVLAEAAAAAELNLHDRIHHAVIEHNHQRSQRFQLSLSVGFALYEPAHPVPLNTLLGRADEAMYRSKRRMKSSAPDAELNLALAKENHG